MNRHESGHAKMAQLHQMPFNGIGNDEMRAVRTKRWKGIGKPAAPTIRFSGTDLAFSQGKTTKSRKQKGLLNLVGAAKAKTA